MAGRSESDDLKPIEALGRTTVRSWGVSGTPRRHRSRPRVNVQELKGGYAAEKYHGENILVHEFGHTGSLWISGTPVPSKAETKV